MFCSTQNYERVCAAQSNVDAYAGHNRVEPRSVRRYARQVSICGPASVFLCALPGILMALLWGNSFFETGSVSCGHVTAAIATQSTALAGTNKPSGDQIAVLVYELNQEDTFLAAPRRSAIHPGTGDIASILSDRIFQEAVSFEVSHARAWEAQLEDEIQNEAYLLAQSHSESALRAPRVPPILSQAINGAHALLNPSGYARLQTEHNSTALIITTEHFRFLCDRTRSGTVPTHYYSIRNGYIPDGLTGAFS